MVVQIINSKLSGTQSSWLRNQQRIKNKGEDVYDDEC